MHSSIRVIILALFMAGFTVAAPTAEQILDRYLALPLPEDPAITQDSYAARLAVLSELKEKPDEAVKAVSNALPKIEEPRQRRELVGALTTIQTKQSAEALAALLKDEDREIRFLAIEGLRLMATCSPRDGCPTFDRYVRYIGTVSTEPKVPGLVSHLIAFADDKDEYCRIRALVALADTGDAQGIAELRNRLTDKSSRVRLHAACLLTEFRDASGLPEMRSALKRLRSLGAAKLVKTEEQHGYYDEVFMLCLSFERITGKSFGEIPIPGWSDDAPAESIGANPFSATQFFWVKPNRRARCQKLLNTWAQWWAWEPGK